MTALRQRMLEDGQLHIRIDRGIRPAHVFQCHVPYEIGMLPCNAYEDVWS